MANFCTKCGNPIDECTCYKYDKDDIIDEPVPRPEPKEPTPPREPLDLKKMLTEFFGITESSKVTSKDPFEDGKKIVPELVEPCGNEIPVRQYNAAYTRSRIIGLFSRVRIQVTNKRILFRASGKSFFGPTLYHSEYTMDQIAGLSISKGVRFALVDFLLLLFLVMPTMVSIGLGLGAIHWIISLILLAGVIAIYVVPAVKDIKILKAHIIKAMLFGLTTGSMFGASLGMGVLGLATGILTIIFMVLFAIKPSLSITIKSKDGSTSVMSFVSKQIFNLESSNEVMPDVDADEVFKQLGAIIQDIQQLGDLAVEKWQVR